MPVLQGELQGLAGTSGSEALPFSLKGGLIVATAVLSWPYRFVFVFSQTFQESNLPFKCKVEKIAFKTINKTGLSALVNLLFGASK